MRKFLFLLVVLSLFVADSASAEMPMRSFKNCTAVKKVYPNGVAKSKAAANKQKKTPKVSAKIYNANKKLDRDKDGSICEG
jgi:hypothetical protein